MLILFIVYVQIQAGLSALEDAMEAGFEDFKVISRIISIV